MTSRVVKSSFVGILAAVLLSACGGFMDSNYDPAAQGLQCAQDISKCQGNKPTVNPNDASYYAPGTKANANLVRDAVNGDQCLVEQAYEVVPHTAYVCMRTYNACVNGGGHIEADARGFVSCQQGAANTSASGGPTSGNVSAQPQVINGRQQTSCQWTQETGTDGIARNVCK